MKMASKEFLFASLMAYLFLFSSAVAAAKRNLEIPKIQINKIQETTIGEGISAVADDSASPHGGVAFGVSVQRVPTDPVHSYEFFLWHSGDELIIGGRVYKAYFDSKGVMPANRYVRIKDGSLVISQCGDRALVLDGRSAFSTSVISSRSLISDEVRVNSPQSTWGVFMRLKSVHSVAGSVEANIDWFFSPNATDTSEIIRASVGASHLTIHKGEKISFPSAGDFRVANILTASLLHGGWVVLCPI